VALVNAVVVALHRVPRAGMKVRALLHVFDAATFLALGVVSAIVLLGWQRLSLEQRGLGARARVFLGGLAWWLVALGLGAWMLSGDLTGPAGRLSFAPLWLARALLVAIAAAGIPLAAGAGRLLARGVVLRAVAVAVAATIAAGNHYVVAHDYPGVHFFAAWAAAVIAGAALTRWQPPLPELGRARLAVGLSVGLASVWSLFVPPSNAVRVQLYRHAGCATAPWLARLERRVRIETRVALSPEARRWYQDRRNEPDVPPTKPGVIPKNAIVLLLVVDALRADVLDPALEARFPNITHLKKTGVEFVQARSPAPGTTLSITSVMTSRFPCQIHWEKLRARDFPHKDPSVRFPEILGKHGVTTVNIQGLVGLGMRDGITRGFAEETIVPGAGGRFANSVRMMPVLLQRLGRVGAGPLFAYLHFEDPHAPYDSVKKVGPPFERYLAEVGQVDAELGLLLAFIREHRLQDRVVIVLTADHGEGFKEHGKSYHSTNVYAEAIHVPLVFTGPGLSPRRVKELVSLVDLGPTFLDLFGAPTPGSYMGQSLVPLLAGKEVELSRPVIAQTMRSIDAMFFRDGLKVIVNHKGGTVELYDLRRDPHESDDLSDELASTARERASMLEAFLRAQTVP